MFALGPHPGSLRMLTQDFSPAASEHTGGPDSCPPCAENAAACCVRRTSESQVSPSGSTGQLWKLLRGDPRIPGGLGHASSFPLGPPTLLSGPCPTVMELVHRCTVSWGDLLGAEPLGQAHPLPRRSSVPCGTCPDVKGGAPSLFRHLTKTLVISLCVQTKHGGNEILKRFLGL